MTAEDHRREIERLEGRVQRRDQDIELHTAILDVLRGMPEGSIVADALATEEGQRVRRKWELKYGRESPI